MRETEAEAVAYVVCQAMGLETTTRSSDYIHMYQGDTDTLSESLDAIQKIAAVLIEQLRDEPDHRERRTTAPRHTGAIMTHDLVAGAS